MARRGAGWTVDTIHEMHERDVRLMQEEIDRRLSDLRILLAERFEAQSKAIERTDTAVSLRFESVNEFRRTLSDQTATFISRPEHVAALDAINALITRNQERINDLELRVSAKLEQIGGRQEGGALIGSTRRVDLALIFQVMAVLGAIAGVIIVAFHH